MDPTKVKIPPLMDLTIDNITENVIRINSNNPDARMQYVLERLVVHLHDFARETRLSTTEWMAGIQFLTKTGQICSDVRQVRVVLCFFWLDVCNALSSVFSGELCAKVERS